MTVFKYLTELGLEIDGGSIARLKALFGTIIKIGVIMQNKLNQNKTTEHPETKLIFGIAGVPLS